MLFRRLSKFLRSRLESSYKVVNEVRKNFRLLEITKTVGIEQLDIDVLVGRKHGARNT